MQLKHVLLQQTSHFMGRDAVIREFIGAGGGSHRGPSETLLFLYLVYPITLASFLSSPDCGLCEAGTSRAPLERLRRSFFCKQSAWHFRFFAWLRSIL